MDYYQILGVAKNATPDEIKKAYRKLAAKHHPDRGGTTSMFQQIEEAYRILSDPQKKQQYDNPVPNAMHGFPGGFSFQAEGFDINSIFGQMFGQAFNQPGSNPFQQNRTQLYRTQVVISLRDAYYGKRHQLHLQLATGPKIVDIDIPKGIRDGSQIRYDKIINNATLVVEFKITNDLRFDRKDNDLYSNYAISVLDLIIGSHFEFTTISGINVEVTVPAITQPNVQLRLTGHGMPIFNTNMYGDQIILLKPYVPSNIADEIKQSILHHNSK